MVIVGVGDNCFGVLCHCVGEGEQTSLVENITSRYPGGPVAQYSRVRTSDAYSGIAHGGDYLGEVA
tara:strand:+ start:915 stop:1112 length:198 start_codon:yes stop_codon:yes gene_type:complete